MLSIEQKIEMEKILNDMDDFREEGLNRFASGEGMPDADDDHWRARSANYIFEEEVLGKCEDCELFFENGKFCKKCKR